MPLNTKVTRARSTRTANRPKAQAKSTPAPGQATAQDKRTPAVAGKSAPVVRATSPALSKRQARAAQRAAERRRRTNIISGVAAAAVVIVLALLLKDRLPAARPSSAHTTASACPATATPVVGPAVAVTPAPNPPALPANAKTVNGDQGLQYVDISAGCGPAVKAGDNVIVNYTGWLQSNGKMFDSSLKPGGSPFEVDNVGQAQVITGWNLGLIGMKPGGTRRLIIPGALGYGSAGAPQGGIPGNATLVFDITVIGFK